MFKEINILKVFFEEPEREFHLRELARIMKKNPVTVKKNLLEFVKSRVILKKKERGLELYSSNSENFSYKELKRTYNRNRLVESGLLDFLKRKFKLPVIVLFGSYERGEDNKQGDIDIFILSEIDEHVKLDDYGKKLRREIQLHIMSKSKFEKFKKEKPDLINSILNGSVLNGFLEVL